MRKLNGYGPSLIVLGTTALLLWAGPLAVRQLTYHQTRVRIVNARQRLAENDVLEQLNQAYRDIADYVAPSVVHISAEAPVYPALGEPHIGQSTGSGWVYDDRGHIITNQHVVDQAIRIQVQFDDGSLREAVVIGADRSTDIAVLEVAPGNLFPAERADMTEDLQQGDHVFAFGSPFDFRFSVTAGVISGTARHVGVIRRGGRTGGYESFIQIDAAINPGNSGGPLTDHRGRVIGMATAIATGGSASEFDEGQFAGIGLAIPLWMIEPVADQIIHDGLVNKGYLGVQTAEISTRLRRVLQLEGFRGIGVPVDTVYEDSPAYVAGVKATDIITRVNGHAVGSTAELRSVISSIVPNETIMLTVWRFADGEAGRTLELPVVLAELGQVLPRQDIGRAGLPRLGLAGVSNLTESRAAELGIPYRVGVLVEGVIPGSRLDQEGVKPGWIITDVRGFPIMSMHDLIRRLEIANLQGGVMTNFVDPDGELHSIELKLR